MPNDFTVTTETTVKFSYLPRDMLLALNRECEYQDKKYEFGSDESIDFFVSLMQREIADVYVSREEKDEDGMLFSVLKVISVGVACLIHHGIVERPDRAGVVQLVPSPEEPEQPEKQP